MSGKSAKRPRLGTLASKLVSEDGAGSELQVARVNQTWHCHTIASISLEMEGLQLKVLSLESQ